METLSAMLGKTRKANGKPAWYWWVFAVVVLLAGFAVAWWVLRGNSRELARLRHEKEKARVQRAQAAAYFNANEHSARKSEALLRVELARLAITRIDEEIQKVEKQHEVDKDSAMRLRWSDLPRAEDS